MTTRKVNFANGEIYHVFNRGVDKRIIFDDQNDLNRFFKSMLSFNQVDPVGSLHEQSFLKENNKKPLVNFIAYNLLENHFHLLLEQVTEGGISEFMKRLQGGYTWAYNKKNKRSGSLLQGTFKSRHIDTNEYLLHVSVYVNLNDKIPLDGLGGLTAKWGKSSWDEYVNFQNSIFVCKGKNIVLEQFKSKEEYKNFALATLEDIKLNKENYKELEE
ncbi:MAG: transposase [bacterium]|nr:transposase [bacterium]